MTTPAASLTPAQQYAQAVAQNSQARAAVLQYGNASILSAGNVFGLSGWFSE